MAEEGCLAQHRAFAQGQKLDNAEFFGRQRHLNTVNQRQMAIQINLQIANRVGGLAMSMRSPDNGI